jgi:hypothetical protein
MYILEGGQFARIYTGMMFKGRYERGKDAPAILVDMQIETGEGVRALI